MQFFHDKLGVEKITACKKCYYEAVMLDLNYIAANH